MVESKTALKKKSPLKHGMFERASSIQIAKYRYCGTMLHLSTFRYHAAGDFPNHAGQIIGFDLITRSTPYGAFRHSKVAVANCYRQQSSDVPSLRRSIRYVTDLNWFFTNRSE